MHPSGSRFGAADADEAPHLFYQRLVGLAGLAGIPPGETRSQAFGAATSDAAEGVEAGEWAVDQDCQQTALPDSADSQYEVRRGQPLISEAPLERGAAAKRHGAVSILPGKGRAAGKPANYEQPSGHGQIQASSISADNIGFQVWALDNH